MRTFGHSAIIQMDIDTDICVFLIPRDVFTIIKIIQYTENINPIIML